MLLPILEFPDPRLRKVAARVGSVTPEIERLVRDMAETMYAAPGVGLAATQVDVHKRVIVMDVSETRDELRVFIDPEIVFADGEAECEEGCLSVPGIYDEVERPDRVTVRALDEHGKALDSAAFAGQLGRWREESIANVVFLIGGADGLSPELRRMGKMTLAFGAATWPHQIVRILLLEQLYRAATILAGHPYHRA